MTPEARKEVLAPQGIDAGVERDPLRPVDPVAAPAEEADEAGLRPRRCPSSSGRDS